MRKLEVTADSLNNVMEFDHVIHVAEDGTVTDGYDLLAPSLYMEVDADGQSVHADDADIIQDAKSYGWKLLTGFTGQYGYHGPVMYSSEFISGGLARAILETPGYYVAVTVECQGPEAEDGEEPEELQPAGWAIAYRTE
jgi:hypothetical protein